MSIPDNIVLDYHDNGRIRGLTEVDPFGAPEGYYVRWHDNGHIAEECTIKDAVMHGEYRTWHENGQIKADANYVTGFKQGLYLTYDTRGRIMREVYYVDSKPHGLVILRTGSDTVIYQFYNYGKHITEQVNRRVVDITNISEVEKTILALELGFVL